jgi:hypothetical protein
VIAVVETAPRAPFIHIPVGALIDQPFGSLVFLHGAARTA